MSLHGKQLSPEMMEIVVHLKNHFDKERKSQDFVSTKDPAGRTAAGLGIGVATVKRIMARYSRSGGQVIGLPSKPPGRPPDRLLENLQPAVRQFIRSQNLKGQRVSVELVRQFLINEHSIDIPKMTLWRAINRWGFGYGEGRRRNSLKEQDHVILARRSYLREKRSNRNSDGSLKRPEVYLDETYINKNHSNGFTWYLEEDGPWVNKPSGVGQRLIVVHAITQNGWVDGAELVFEAKKRTGDYHGQMNWENFSKWFLDQLVPNIGPGSIVVMDNAKYHNVLAEDVFPSSCTKKEELRSWLSHNGYPWREDMLKSELMELCTRLAPSPEYRLDKLAREYNISILRTPPYHPELQPIETCWAVMKNHMADNCDFSMAGLRKRLPEAFSKVKSSTIKDIIAKVQDQEDKYWKEDEKLDEEYAKDRLEEILGTALFEGEGLSHYIGES